MDLLLVYNNIHFSKSFMSCFPIRHFWLSRLFKSSQTTFLFLHFLFLCPLSVSSSVERFRWAQLQMYDDDSYIPYILETQVLIPSESFGGLQWNAPCCGQ